MIRTLSEVATRGSGVQPGPSTSRIAASSIWPRTSRGLPSWLAKNTLSEELFRMERNPYFFGVDPEGNQLPTSTR